MIIGSKKKLEKMIIGGKKRVGGIIIRREK